MDKLVSFFTNKWFKRALSVLGLGYPVFLCYVAWLTMGFYLEPTNAVALFVVYLFINVLFGGIMLLTRNQIISRALVLIDPLVVFAILILGFRQWYIIIPPFVICVLTFFLVRSDETKKMIFGTIYLMLYVVGVLVYLTFEMHMGRISFTDVDLSIRSTNYNYSPDGNYRVVTYVEPEKDQTRTVMFYLEKTDEDISLPFLEARKAVGSIHLITSGYDDPAKIEWKGDNTLYVDGRLREFDFDAVLTESEDENGLFLW